MKHEMNFLLPFFKMEGITSVAAAAKNKSKMTNEEMRDS
jgi:hypothetical protein